jgi:hypothetical protein
MSASNTSLLLGKLDDEFFFADSKMSLVFLTASSCGVGAGTG